MNDALCKSLFLIDDDAIQHAIFNLQNTHYHLADFSKMFTEGGRAIDDLRSNQDNYSALPDVILLDIHMPVMDGWQFLDKLEQLQPEICKNINVLIVSSSIDDNDRRHSEQYSCVRGFISKPLSPAKLKSTLRGLQHN